MLARIIFCVVIAAAILAVVLLATVSPLPRRSGGHKGAPGLRTFTVYIHPTASTTAQQQQQLRGAVHRGEASALVFQFHHRMTAGPENTSRTVGAASGFLLLTGEGGAATSVFDIVHLAFDGAAGMSGGLCVEASNEQAPGPGRRGRGRDGEEELRVVAGTGDFAFVRGHAVVLRVQRLDRGAAAMATALQLELSVASAGT